MAAIGDVEEKTGLGAPVQVGFAPGTRRFAMEGFASRDKTSYEGFVIDDPPDDFRVRSDIYRDPAIFEDEMRNIFEKSWVYVGHDSEIPNAGDFKTAAIGRLPIIISRDEEGALHVLLNICRHRGTVICRSERGNKKEFVCPYHNWIYAIDGRLISASAVGGGYPEDFAERIGGLIKVPRVALYRGMIFASVAPEGESLEEQFGAVKSHIDLWFDQSPTSSVRVQEPRCGSYPANWKFQLENTTDGWHARYVHESAFSTLADFKLRDPSGGWKGCTRGFDRGHGTLERPPRPVLPPDMHEAYMKLLGEAHGPERAEQSFYRRHITLFPNLHLMDFKFRVVQPVAVDKTIIYEYPVELEGIPPEFNRAFLDRLKREGSIAAGFVNADDVEIFARIQSGLHASSLMRWFVLSRGMREEEVSPTGERVAADSFEVPQRAIYREWARLMNGGA